MSLEALTSRSLSMPRARLSQAVLVPEGGPLLFVSGLTANDAAGQPVGAGHATAQARAVLQAIGELCEHAGGVLADVVKLTVFLTDMRRAAEVGRVRAEFFPEPPYPASSMVEVSRLVSEEQIVEIEAVAAIGRSAPAESRRSLS